MTDPYTIIQEHLGIALRKLSLFEARLAEGHERSRDAARCLADLQRVAQELDNAFSTLKRERLRLISIAEDAGSVMRRAQWLFGESPSPCLVVQRGGAQIEEANAAASRLLNVSQRHLVGKPFTHFLQQDREMFLHQLQGRGSGASRQWLVTLRPRERGVLRVKVNAIADTDTTAAIVLIPDAGSAPLSNRARPHPEPAGAGAAPGA